MSDKIIGFKARYIDINLKEVGWIFWDIMGNVEKVEYDNGCIDNAFKGRVDINDINEKTIIQIKEK